MQILCSPYFEKLMFGIIGNIPKKMVAKIPDYVRHLVSHAIIAGLEGQQRKLEF